MHYGVDRILRSVVNKKQIKVEILIPIIYIMVTGSIPFFFMKMKVVS